MKRLFTTILALAVISTTTAFADDTDALAGKWTLEKANDQGQSLTRMLEIKQNKFTLTILRDGDKVVMYVEGDIKAEKLGPFNTVKFTNMKVGRSSSETQQFDEERTSIYQLGEGTLALASELDAERTQKPSLDVYKKMAAAASEPLTLYLDKIVMHQTPQVATWFVCFEAKTEGAMQRFNVPNQSYDKDGVTIPMGLKIANVRPGQTCTFKCQLDDIETDVCTDDIDNTSSGKFTVTESGSQEFKPEDHWRYTVYWHLK